MTARGAERAPLSGARPLCRDEVRREQLSTHVHGVPSQESARADQATQAHQARPQPDGAASTHADLPHSRAARAGASQLALLFDALGAGAREHEFGEGRAPAGGPAAEDARVGAPQEASTYQGYGAKESDYRPERWKGYRDDYGFTGKEDDVEFGIVYFGKRFYSPGLNRWITADPLGVHAPGEADLNLYAYVQGHVLAAIDPLGLVDNGESHAGNVPATQDNKKQAPSDVGANAGVGTGTTLSNKSIATGAVVTLGLMCGATELGVVAGVVGASLKVQSDSPRVTTPGEEAANDVGDLLGLSWGGASRATARAAPVVEPALPLTTKIDEIGASAEKLADGHTATVGGHAAETAPKQLPVSQTLANAGGKIISFVTQKQQTFYRVYSDNNVGAFLTAVKPKSSAFAREALALPPGNTANFVQEVLVPAGTRLQRSRALPAFGQRGGAEQFELLQHIPAENFGAGEALK